jgi:hypothetical protein
MNLPNQNEVFKNILPRIHNAIFRCIICEETYDLKKTVMKVVVRCLGVAPVNAGQPARPEAGQSLAPLFEYAPVCPECFEQQELIEEEPKIVVPNFVPPKDVAAALKKN